MLQRKNGEASSKFSAAKNGQVCSNFAAAKTVMVAANVHVNNKSATTGKLAVNLLQRKRSLAAFSAAAINGLASSNFAAAKNGQVMHKSLGAGEYL